MAALITITEANAVLNDEVYPEWDLLEDPDKQLYINRASAYVQLSWSPPSSDTDFVWTDDTTWDTEAELKDLIAQYADAIRGGLIYSQGAAGSISLSPIKSKKIVAGPVETTTLYAQPDIPVSKESTRPIDDQMLVIGFAKINPRNTLTRV